MRELLKVSALLCKMGAIIIWLCISWVRVGMDVSNLRATSQPMYRDAPQDWGTPAFEHRTYLEIALLVAMTLFALLPNCWLVFSPKVFAISLLIALSPFCLVISSITEWSDLTFIAFLMPEFGPLPLSLVLSFLRHRKGEKIFYA